MYAVLESFAKNKTKIKSYIDKIEANILNIIKEDGELSKEYGEYFELKRPSKTTWLPDITNNPLSNALHDHLDLNDTIKFTTRSLTDIRKLLRVKYSNDVVEALIEQMTYKKEGEIKLKTLD